MHRMRHLLFLTGLVVATSSLIGTSALADPTLSTPTAANPAGDSTQPQTYPDIIANLGSGVSYTYDPTAQEGVFHLKNTAYVLVTGTNASDEYDITPTADGSRYQTLNVTLDKSGNFVSDPGNMYQVYGTITANGKTFTGLLLSGVPIDFSTSNVGGVTQFQADLKLDGTGSLSSFFGPNSYIHLIAETGNGFTGSFTTDFNISKVSTNTHGPDATGQPFPIPEPTTMVFLAISGAGLVYGRRRARNA